MMEVNKRRVERSMGHQNSRVSPVSGGHEITQTSLHQRRRTVIIEWFTCNGPWVPRGIVTASSDFCFILILFYDIWVKGFYKGLSPSFFEGFLKYNS